MSIDRSLRGANMLVRHRNVLNRVEKLARLSEEEKWTDKKSVFGLPKVEHRKKEIVKVAKEATPAEGAAAGAAAPAAAAGGKAAAPAAGAKAAAPAAKAPAKK